MNKVILTILFLAMTFGSTSAQKNATGERKVKFQSYADARYFERNDTNLEGDASFLVFTNDENFERIFHPAAINGENLFLPDNVFDSKLVIATIKRGNFIRTFDLIKVTIKNGKLYVWFNTTDQQTPNATFNSHLILTVDKKDYSEIIFMENGKTAGAVSVIQNKSEIASESCCTDAEMKMEIVYQFNDAPVSPEYQRSFRVTLNKTNAKLRFQRYGKEPTEKTVKTGDGKFKEIIELARKIKIRKEDASGKNDCFGASSERLKILDAKRNEILSGYFDKCTGIDSGSLTGDTTLLKAKITALFPNEEYLK